MTTYLGKSCSFGLPRVPFVNCLQFMYLVISLLVLRAGYGIWLYQFLIIAYLFSSYLSYSGVKSSSLSFRGKWSWNNFYGHSLLSADSQKGSCRLLAKLEGTIEPGHEKLCFMPYANNKGADQRAHPRSLISALVVRYQDRMIPLVYIFDISRF